MCCEWWCIDFFNIVGVYIIFFYLDEFGDESGYIDVYFDIV